MEKKRRRRIGDNVLVQTTKQRLTHVRHGLYLELGGIDGRTRLGKTVVALRNMLREFVGQPTPVTELLIQRIVYKAVRLGLYEAACLTELGNRESDHYLPMANSMRLDLVVLATMTGKPKAPNLSEYLSIQYGSGKKE